MSVVSSFTLHPVIMGNVRTQSNGETISFSSSLDGSAFKPYQTLEQFIPIQNSVLVPGTMLQDRTKRSPSHRVELGDGTTCRPPMPNPFQNMNSPVISNHTSPQALSGAQPKPFDFMSLHWQSQIRYHECQKKVFRLEEEKRKLRIQVIELQAKLLEKEEETRANSVAQESSQSLINVEPVVQEKEVMILEENLNVTDWKERKRSFEPYQSQDNHTLQAGDHAIMNSEKNPTTFRPIVSPKPTETCIDAEDNQKVTRYPVSFNATDDDKIDESNQIEFQTVQSLTTKDIAYISEESQVVSSSKSKSFVSNSTQTNVVKEESVKQFPSEAISNAVNKNDMISNRRTTRRQTRMREGNVAPTHVILSSSDEKLATTPVVSVRRSHRHRKIESSSVTQYSPEMELQFNTTPKNTKLNKSCEGISPISAIAEDVSLTSSDNEMETTNGIQKQTNSAALSMEKSRPQRRRRGLLSPSFKAPALKKAKKRSEAK
jgi:hypothetical protein